MSKEIEEVGRVLIREVTFIAAGDRTRAFVVSPSGTGPFPVVLYAHGTGIDAEYFVDEARRGARLGLAGISVDLPFRPPFPGPLFADDRDRVALLDAVTVLLDVVNLADELPEVDAARIGYVGLSLGATVGAQLRAQEPRIAAFVLVSAVARVADYSSFADHPQTLEMVRSGTLDRYLEAMRAVDPITHADAASQAPLLLQFGEHDPLIPKSSADELLAALGPAAQARWYGGGHDLDLKAQDERLRWLARELGATA